MAVQYMKIPTSSKKLSDDVIRIVDMYQSSQVSEDDMIEVITTWKENVPELLFAPDGEGKINRTLLKVIGKKREKVILTFLANIK